VSGRLRVGLVGAGEWGSEYARIFADRPDVEFVGIVGRDAERTRARAETFRTRPFTDIDEMLAETAPDFVTACLPNEGHFAPTLQLIRAGVPLLVEKPLVFELDEADELIDEAAARGLFFAINFNHRLAEPVRRAKAAIDAGEIGRPVFATWRFGGERNRGSTSPHANLIETQCHGFDMLEHLVAPITSVMAQMTDATYGDWSTMALALTFDQGAVGSLVGSYDSSYAYPDTQLIEVNGTEGRVVIHDTVREVSIHRHGDETSRVWRPNYFDDESRRFRSTFDRHVDAVLAALRAGEQPPVHARAGRRALRLAHAAIASHETGLRVATPDA
jgi:predicted dehydrogenase